MGLMRVECPSVCNYKAYKDCHISRRRRRVSRGGGALVKRDYKAESK